MTIQKTKQLVNGVVSGIGGYGNCMGVPTVGGEVTFDKSYNGNIIVNAMTVGLADSDKIFYSAASQVGASVVYVGSKTGRDGINGAVMASDEFKEGDEDKRPTVQVGDPFCRKTSPRSLPRINEIRLHSLNSRHGSRRPNLICL